MLRVDARVVVNATGAWSPLTARLGGLPEASVAVRPGKGIHVVYPQRLTNFAITAQAIEGRQVFLEPWENMTVLGTTDEDYYGNLDEVTANEDEVRYLIQAVETVFPSIRDARPIGTYAGVRPTLHRYGPLEGKLSRDHKVIDHGAAGMPGVYSMIGGKLASYRLFAEEVGDLLCRSFGVNSPCTTHQLVLPGGDSLPNALDLAVEEGITPVAARRLVYRHGSRALRILDRTKQDPTESAVICPCEPVLEAEIRHVLNHEFATTVEDVSRRTRLGLGACGGMRCALRTGLVVAEERGLPPREGLEQANRFLDRLAAQRMSVFGPEQAQQEALLLAYRRAQFGRGGAL